MTGGRRPPGPTPKWLDTLSIIPDVVDNDTLFIYTGIVNHVKNVVARLTVGHQVSVVAKSTNHYFYYDEASDEIAIVESTASGWSAAIISGSGRPWGSTTAYQSDNLSKDDILFKCNPAE